MIESLYNNSKTLTREIENAIYTMDSCRCENYDRFHTLDNKTVRALELLKTLSTRMEISAHEQGDEKIVEDWLKKTQEVKNKYQQYVSSFCLYSSKTSALILFYFN